MSEDGVAPRLFNMGLLKKSLEAIVAQAAGLALGLASGIIIARCLGPADKGAVALYTMMIGFLATLGNPGMGAANIFLVGRGRLGACQAWANSWWLSWIMGTALGLLTFFCLPLFSILFQRPVDMGHLAIALIGLPPAILLDCQLNLLRGLQRIGWFNAAQLARTAARLIFVALLVAGLGYGLAGALWAANLSLGLAVVLTAMMLRRQGGLQLTPSLAGLKASLAYGLKLQPGQIVQFLNYRLDLFFLAALADSRQVGLYATAVFIAELVWYIPNGINIVLYPAVSASRDDAQARQISIRAMRHSMLWSVALAVALGLASRPMINLLYGQTFDPSAQALRILLLGMLAMVPAKLALNHLAGIGKPQYLTYAALLGLAGTTALDLWLIPRWGFIGAAWASVGSYLISFGGSLYWLKKHAGIGPGQGLLIRKPDLAEYQRWLGL